MPQNNLQDLSILLDNSKLQDLLANLFNSESDSIVGESLKEPYDEDLLNKPIIINGESLQSYVMRKSGRKPSQCSCKKCQSRCVESPGVLTPPEVYKIYKVGLGSLLSITAWMPGMLYAGHKEPTMLIAPILTETGCSFFKNGKCVLHNTGLKPLECRLAHHSIREDNYNPSKGLAFIIASFWRDERFEDYIANLLRYINQNTPNE